MNRLKILSAIVLLVVTLSGCKAESAIEDSKSESRLFAMNTYITFTTYGDDADETLKEAEGLIKEAEKLWSVTDEDSEIYKANHNNGQPITISEDTSKLLSFAFEMAQLTDGALEPTLYPVLTAWGFTTDNKQVPSQEEIDTLLQKIGYERILLEDTTLTVPEGMQIDMGAVAKGYTADLVAELLQDRGITSAIFSLGGNIQAIGSRPDGSNWRIGIRAPWEKGNLGVLEINDVAVVTSGGYENYFKDEAGNIYWHILDPATGYPADSDLLSVTIIGSEGKLCDALSTALFVMGKEKAVNYWKKHGGFDMLLVTEEGEILLTEGIAEQFTQGDDREESLVVIEA